MVLKFLRGLVGGGSAGTTHYEVVEYEGYSIEPMPEKREGGWSTCGVITREIGGTLRSHRFIRADMSTSEDGAVELTVRKAQRLIDEQGERLFGDI